MYHTADKYQFHTSDAYPAEDKPSLAHKPATSKYDEIQEYNRIRSAYIPDGNLNTYRYNQILNNRPKTELKEIITNKPIRKLNTPPPPTPSSILDKLENFNKRHGNTNTPVFSFFLLLSI